MIDETNKTTPLSDDSLGEVAGGRATWINDNTSSRQNEDEDGKTRHTYTVKSGDTLGKIAKRYGVTVDNLVAWNKGSYPSLKTNRNLIQIGWVLEYYV